MRHTHAKRTNDIATLCGLFAGKREQVWRMFGDTQTRPPIKKQGEIDRRLDVSILEMVSRICLVLRFCYIIIVSARPSIQYHVFSAEVCSFVFPPQRIQDFSIVSWLRTSGCGHLTPETVSNLHQ